GEESDLEYLKFEDIKFDDNVEDDENDMDYTMSLDDDDATELDMEDLDGNELGQDDILLPVELMDEDEFNTFKLHYEKFKLDGEHANEVNQVESLDDQKSQTHEIEQFNAKGQGRNPKVLKKDSGTDFMSKYVMW
ncbi:hypothetical protein C6P42_004319, partial [Pichia californica]